MEEVAEVVRTEAETDVVEKDNAVRTKIAQMEMIFSEMLMNISCVILQQKVAKVRDNFTRHQK